MNNIKIAITLIKRLISTGTISLGLFLLFSIIPLFQLAGNHDSEILATNEIIEGYTADIFFKNRGEISPSPDVAIVGIGENSIKQLGRFPFPRFVYKKFIDQLDSYETKVAAFDILFADVQDSALKTLVNDHIESFPTNGMGFSSVRKHMEEFAKKVYESDDIKLMQDSFSNSDTKIVLAHSFNDMGLLSGRFRLEEDSIKTNSKLLSIMRHNINISNNCQLQENFSNFSQIMVRNPLLPSAEIFSGNTHPKVGHIKFLKDSKGGIVRYFPIIAYHHRSIVASLSLQSVATFLEQPISINCPTGGGQFGPEFLTINSSYYKDKNPQKLARYDAPINGDGRIWINHLGGPGKIPTYEFVDILNGKIDKKKLQGKLVFVGAIADSMGDIVANPYTPILPGVEIHASIASNLLNGTVLYPSENYALIALLLMFATSVFLPLLLRRKRIRIGFLATTSILIAYIYYAYNIAFLEQNQMLPIALPLAHYLSLVFFIVIFQYFSEENEKKFIRKAFSQFVSTSVVDEIIEQEKPLSLGGEKKEVTVLFTDIQGFTSISEKLDANTLTELLNLILTDLTKIVFTHEGTLDKYVGDAMMCFWGAPIDAPEHAYKACLSALEMQKRVEEMRSEWSEKFGQEISIRVGVNTGEVSVGNMGSTQVFDYTVVGDSVNIASRLESLNRHYHSKILVGEQTFATTKHKLGYRRIDSVKVKGKSNSIDVFELISETSLSEAEKTQYNTYEAALDLLIAGNWEEAMSAFESYHSKYPEDKAAEEMLSRIESIKSSSILQADWDGSWSYSD